MIKKILSILTISFFLLSPISSFAQAQALCSPITAENQVECCSGTNADINAQACANYVPPAAQCTIITDTNFSVCCTDLRNLSRQCNNYLTGVNTTEGTIGSGTQNTNPQNGGAGAVSGTIGTTPQSSAAALKSCSAIRFDSLLDILIWLKCIIGAAIIPLIFTIAFLLFLRGVLKFMQSADNKEKKEDSKRLMWYGVIGLVVMVSVWGIVNIVNSTFGFGNTVPQLQTDCLTTDKNNPCKK